MPICAPTLGYSHLTCATTLGEIALCFLPSSNHRAPDRSPSQNPLPTPTWLCITFWLSPRKKSSIAVTPTMYPKLEKVSVLHSTFPFSECSNCALLPEAIALGMYCARSEFDVRRPDMYTCLQSLPTCSGSNSITVRRVHPFCNHAAFGFGVIDCAEPEGRIQASKC